MSFRSPATLTTRVSPLYTKGSSFLFLERASQTTLTLKRMSMRAPKVDLGAENPNIYEARDYYPKP